MDDVKNVQSAKDVNAHAASQQVSEPVNNPEEAAALIADQLGETEDAPRKLMLSLVQHLGVETALAFLKQTHDIEGQGGMMLPDGSRRRTPGGIWFHLVRKNLPLQEVRRLFPSYRPPKTQKVTAKTDATKNIPSSPPPAPFHWAERETVLTALGTERGALRTVKMTVIGRPGKVIERGQCVITTMTGGTKAPALPKGVPIPPETETMYTLYIDAKQWKKVVEAIADPEDALIVEGYPQLDLKTRSIAVFVTNTTTKHLQRALRETQK